MNLSQIDNTKCLLKSMLNAKMYPKQTQQISQQIVLDLFHGQINNKTIINYKICNTKCLLKLFVCPSFFVSK